MLTISILPPCSASTEATMETACLTPLSLVPCVSMKTFLVLSVSFVSSPFIMGGKERTSPFASVIIGQRSPTKCANAMPFSCLFKISRGVISSAGKEPERRLHLVQIMYANRNLSPLPAKRFMDFLLQLHKGTEAGVSHSQSAHHCSAECRAHVCNRLVHNSI